MTGSTSAATVAKQLIEVSWTKNRRKYCPYYGKGSIEQLILFSLESTKKEFNHLYECMPTMNIKQSRI